MNENQEKTTDGIKTFSQKLSEQMEKEMEAIKQEFKEKAESIAISEDQKEVIQELLDDAIKKAYILGKASETDLSEISKAAADRIGDFYKQTTEPSAAERAEKYKDLYHNQRIITAYIQGVVQLLQAQIQLMESDGNLFTSIIDRMPSIFGTPPVIERADTAFASANP